MKKDVLFITDNSSQTSNFEKRISGIEEGLGEDIDLHIKYVSRKTIENIEYPDYFVDDVKKALQEEKYEAVIVGDYYTLKLAIKYRNDMLKNIPIVF